MPLGGYRPGALELDSTLVVLGNWQISPASRRADAKLKGSPRMVSTATTMARLVAWLARSIC